MATPSDAASRNSGTTERDRGELRRRDGRWSGEQKGMALAALVAFLGVAYVGPAVERIFRKPRLEDRIAVRLRDARRRAHQAGDKARKRVRRLGGGAVRR